MSPCPLQSCGTLRVVGVVLKGSGKKCGADVCPRIKPFPGRCNAAPACAIPKRKFVAAFAPLRSSLLCIAPLQLQHTCLQLSRCFSAQWNPKTCPAFIHCCCIVNISCVERVLLADTLFVESTLLQAL